MGAFRLAEEPRGGAGCIDCSGPCAAAALAGDGLRLPPLPRLRRVRRPAPAAPQDPRRSPAPRRRQARTRQRREALARRHPRDRVHRAADAGGARRAVPRDPHPRHTARPAAAGRARPDEARDGHAAGRSLHVLAPGRTPHPVPGRPADPSAARQRRRSALDRPEPGPGLRTRGLPVADPAGRGARTGGRRIRRAAARRPGPGALG